MTQIVIMLFEDVSQPECSEQRYRVEVHFSPGVKGRLELLQKGYKESKEFPLGASSSTCTVTKSSPDEVSKSSMWVKRLPVNLEMLVDDAMRQGNVPSLGSKSTPNMSLKNPGPGRSLKSASEGQLPMLRSPKSPKKSQHLDSHSQIQGHVSILQEDDEEILASKGERLNSHSQMPGHVSILQEDDKEKWVSKTEHLDSYSETMLEHISILQEDDGERKGGKVAGKGSKTRLQVGSQLGESPSDKYLDLVASGIGTYSDGPHHNLKEIGNYELNYTVPLIPSHIPRLLLPHSQGLIEVGTA